MTYLNGRLNLIKGDESGSIMVAALLLMVSLAIAMVCFVSLSPVITPIHGYLQSIPESNIFFTDFARNNVDIAFGYGWRLLLMISLPVASTVYLIVEIHRSQTSSNTGTIVYTDEWEQ